MDNRSFVFISRDGHTQAPNTEDINVLENCQVLGFGEGCDCKAALVRMLDENRWLLQSSFDDVIAYELLNETPKYLSVSDVIETE